jgi:hypothetical protein
MKKRLVRSPGRTINADDGIDIVPDQWDFPPAGSRCGRPGQGAEAGK